MNSDRDTPCGVGCPIRRPRDHRSLASPPGFSQRATSFIASQCQGIHQMPLLALDPRRSPKGSTYGAPPHKTAAHRGKTPHTQRPHMKTLLGYAQALRPEPIRLGHMTNSLFTLQTTPPPGLPRTVSLDLLQPPDGGGERDRTDDLLLAKQALSQLSYTPFVRDQKTEVRDQICILIPDIRSLALVGQGGFEPPTSRLSSARSNQLSY